MPPPIKIRAQAIEQIPVADLLPYANNARLHGEESVAAIVASMQEFGWTAPILVDPKGGIIAGHGRVLAAQRLGLNAVPCIRLAGLSKAQVRALIIADNQTALRSSWDDTLLRFEIAALDGAGFNLPALGFDPEALAALLNGPAVAEPAGPGLNERFGVAPFSVLNAREGWWQDRKRAWLALGIRSEVGRGENLLAFSDTINEPDPAKRAAKAKTGGGKPSAPSPRTSARS